MDSQATILLVDDDPTMRSTVAEFLGLFGYAVRTATDGKDALHLMETFLPDMIISDITMPIMDGYEFCERVRDNPEWTPIPFIFLTARSHTTDVRLGTALGADYYLVKPFEPEDLLVAVQARLKRTREIRSSGEASAERMKQQLMTIFGHKLRTPLTYIYGYTSLLQDNQAELTDAQVTGMLSSVEQGAKRLMKLVEDLLLMMRIDSGAAAIEIERYRTTVELGEIVQAAVTRLEAQAHARGVQIEIDVPNGLYVKGVSTYLQDVLTRLLDNAIKFSPMEDGYVSVRAEQRGERVAVAIQDNGIGIERSQQHDLFERFHQIDRETMEQPGTGLGLVIARGLTRLHGGEITVESEAGQGATFTVELPV